jgi:lipopolysaccharide/colanic/teichoic acid biosynthesis glycosyltransferase
MRAAESPYTDTDARSSWAYQTAKRVLDIVVALAVLIGLAPLWLLVAIAVRLTSSGPALYKAEVAGQFGRPFTYYKFRSMHHGANDEVQRLFRRDFVRANRPYRLEQTADGERRPVYKVVDDPRVTTVGRIIRELSIDEVPQFINVLRGEMSVVGPRPPLAWEVRYYQPWHWERLAVKPGITGPAQVRSRHRLSFDEMARIDIDYVRRRSLRRDLRIIASTPFALLRDSGER